MIDSNKIRSRIADDVLVTPMGEQWRVGTPLLFDDGDRCSLYLTERNGEIVLSDLGDIFMRADYENTDLLSPPYRDQYERLLSYYGLSESHGEFEMRVPEERIGESIFVFAQAALELVRLAKTSVARQLLDGSDLDV